MLHQNKLHYQYYAKGLVVKMFGAIGLTLIYVYYYGGGDTVNYYESSLSILNLFPKHPLEASEIILGYTPSEYLSLFDVSTGYPDYWTDKHAFFMVRFTTVFTFFGCGSFIATALILAKISYYGIWKMYEVFVLRFPDFKKELAIAILFIPSVVFWGSGILKDAITIAAVGSYTYFFYHCFINRSFTFRNILGIVLSVYLLIALKPYIFFALLPGSLIWGSNEFAKKIHNKYLRGFFTPLLVLLGSAAGFFILSSMDEQLGLYSIDNVMERAVVVQQDQKQDYYGGHSFDIGDFDATLPSMLSKSHLALAATFFRPYLWEAGNAVMLLSGLENFLILMATIFLLFKLQFFGFFRTIFGQPLLLFAFIFAIFFGFAVGLSTSNFGSLVRLKIPCIPFFAATLLLLLTDGRKGKTLKRFALTSGAKQ